jgi:hypothetical protein
MLLAAAIVLILMVIVGRSVAGAGSPASPPVKTGADKAYDEMKKDGDLEDPKEEMRGILKDL